MNRRVSSFGLALALGFGYVAASGMPAAAAPVTTVVVEVPGPGNQATWKKSLLNDTGSPATVFLGVVDVAGEEGAFGELLTVSIGRGDSEDIIPPTTLNRWNEKGAVPVGTVTANGTFDIGGVVRLDRVADNSIEGKSASITFRLTLQVEDPKPLAITGAYDGLALASASYLAVLLGGALIVRRYRGVRHEEV